MKVPNNWDEAVGLGGKLLWVLTRIHVISLAIGAVGMIGVQLLTGFWTFRSEHQAIIRAHYEETLEAHKAFQRQIERYNSVFEGNTVQPVDAAEAFDEAAPSAVREIQGARSFDDAAQAYIREINEVSRLLPGTDNEVADYIDAITALRKFYVVNDPPEVGSLEWISFYGQFRLDLDQYIQSRDAYLEELASEVGSYWRAVRNS
ncbi:hypothetical protein PSM7751_01128 [Pseudooceanicola marinus]|uniref:Uncharacterized protein n=2 Tax=Pseudooceanicola marinus TaxID=396013 RepID=A0A1X6YRS0_9RHOB|nr:hypothetical protein PSM7751_01128 [Pseudooceanicola marinus]